MRLSTISGLGRFDSVAALTHLGTFGQKFADRYLEVFVPTRLVVYGSPGEAVQYPLAGYEPVFMKPEDGFSR